MAEIIKKLVLVVYVIGSGSVIFDYIKELRNSLADINANCALDYTSDGPSPKTKQKIKYQIEEALNDIRQSSAVKKAAQQSLKLKSISSKKFEQEFVDHIENIIATTPVHEITTLVDVTQPQEITPEEYIQSIVQASVKFANINSSDLKLQQLEELQEFQINETPDQFSVRLEPMISYPVDNDITTNVNNVDYASKKITNGFSVVLASI